MVQQSPDFVLQSRRKHLGQVHRVVTVERPRFCIAMGPDLAELEATVWAFIVTELPALIPPDKKDPRDRHAWLLAFYKQRTSALPPNSAVSDSDDDLPSDDDDAEDRPRTSSQRLKTAPPLGEGSPGVLVSSSELSSAAVAAAGPLQPTAGAVVSAGETLGVSPAKPPKPAPVARTLSEEAVAAASASPAPAPAPAPVPVPAPAAESAPEERPGVSAAVVAAVQAANAATAPGAPGAASAIGLKDRLSSALPNPMQVLTRAKIPIAGTAAGGVGHVASASAVGPAGAAALPPKPASVALAVPTPAVAPAVPVAPSGGVGGIGPRVEVLPPAERSLAERAGLVLLVCVVCALLRHGSSDTFLVVLLALNTAVLYTARHRPQIVVHQNAATIPPSSASGARGLRKPT
eukprot:TRINITY_DN1415_c0_g4_i1.p1 TRINITY_DN1415_c0_g4~~TRINITY_DN1415_c0_g4_i1.p1  ORF type:complete len:424 (-),score=92.26 TRINITY_DN1415_c0_g4_i1:54-1268(-)